MHTILTVHLRFYIPLLPFFPSPFHDETLNEIACKHVTSLKAHRKTWVFNCFFHCNTSSLHLKKKSRLKAPVVSYGAHSALWKSAVENIYTFHSFTNFYFMLSFPAFVWNSTMSVPSCCTLISLYRFEV